MQKTIALIGNPNSGKTSVFNALTGLAQKVGNYPGITVERKMGYCFIDGQNVEVIDLPGTYSLHPHSRDEKAVLNHILQFYKGKAPDLYVYVADSTQLDKHLLLLTQLMDLHLPLIVLFNLSDIVQLEDGDINKLQRILPIPMYRVSARKDGAEELKFLLSDELKRVEETKKQALKRAPFYSFDSSILSRAAQITGVQNDQYNQLVLCHHRDLDLWDVGTQEKIDRYIDSEKFHSTREQVDEVMGRYAILDSLVKPIMERHAGNRHLKTDRIDHIISHRIWGPAIFLGLMILIFNMLFNLANVPMEWIDAATASLQSWTKEQLSGWFGDFLADGLIAGIGGIIIFVPQIALLFLIIGFLEDIGYMSRAVYLFDGALKRLGLNGRSLVSLVSGGACAIPAIMSTRTIKNWKERLITILVTPFISCSARLPVFIILIALAIPYRPVAGVFNTQGLMLTVLYLSSAVVALISAWALSKILKSDAPSYLAMEMPDYRAPNIKNVLINTLQKVRAFVVEAGKIILIVSLVIWVLSRFGPSSFTGSEATVMENHSSTEPQDLPIEESFIGIFGKAIEPAIRPLGYDWKIGIGLLTSFAAREVFVGTLSTIYEAKAEETLIEKLRSARRNDGSLVFSFATCVSLMVFYLLAMQCMSTLAVVKKETLTWKWPILQFVVMSLMAYMGSLAAYQLLT